jgi:hypothetical protein
MIHNSKEVERGKTERESASADLEFLREGGDRKEIFAASERNAIFDLRREK